MTDASVTLIMSQREIEELQRGLEEMRENITKLHTAVCGDETHGVDGLVKRLRRVEVAMFALFIGSELIDYSPALFGFLGSVFP